MQLVTCKNSSLRHRIHALLRELFRAFYFGIVKTSHTVLSTTRELLIGVATSSTLTSTPWLHTVVPTVLPCRVLPGCIHWWTVDELFRGMGWPAYTWFQGPDILEYIATRQLKTAHHTAHAALVGSCHHCRKKSLQPQPQDHQQQTR